MFTISVKANFWASHQLTLPDGSKEPLHNHNWLVTADVSSDKLNSAGFVMDFCQLKAVIEKIASKFDNTQLEKIDYFKQNNPSAENVAMYIYEKFEPALPKGVKLEAISIVEEPGCTAKFCK